MYEARQNKEKVSRRIDVNGDMVRQQVNIDSSRTFNKKAKLLMQNIEPKFFKNKKNNTNNCCLVTQLFNNPFNGYFYKQTPKPYKTNDNFTLHHLVPGSKIATLFQTMADNDLREHFMGTLFDVMLFYTTSSLDFLQDNKIEIKYLFEKIKYNVNNPEEIKTSDAEKMWKYIIWYPRNLVQGPHTSIRQNDPADSYDIQAAESVGINSTQANHNRFLVNKLDKKLDEKKPITEDEIIEISQIYRHGESFSYGIPIPKYASKFDIENIDNLYQKLLNINDSIDTINDYQKLSDNKDKVKYISINLTRIKDYYEQETNIYINKINKINEYLKFANNLIDKCNKVILIPTKTNYLDLDLSTMFQ